ncbi:MAG TPA: hypothetical protein VGM32_04210 [Rhodopila sp.]|jgi:hypothetical protein
MNAKLAEAPRPTVSGYVEAMTATAVLGWAWAPGQTCKLSIELHLGDEIVAETIADRPRTDLAQGGVGDGSHAFELSVPEGLRNRLADVQVVARGPGGTSAVLPSVPGEGGIEERLARLARGLDAVIASQRVLHRNVQAALLKPSAQPAGGSSQATVEAIAATQAALHEDITTLELFVTRVEQGLSGLPAPPVRFARLPWAVALAAAALAAFGLSVWAVILAMPS